MAARPDLPHFNVDVDPELLLQLQRIQSIRSELAQNISCPVELRRKVSEAGARLSAYPSLSVQTEDVIVPGAWHDIPLRIYRREGGAARRILMYFHGGGWVTGSIETHDDLCAHLAQQTDYLVVSVGYRLAPEHPYPAANDDALAASLWMLEHRSEYGIAHTESWAMGGDSAGAHIALSTTLLFQNNGWPTCDRLLLFYPPVAPRVDTPSQHLYRNGPGLTAVAMDSFWHSYAGGDWQAAEKMQLDLRRLPGLATLPACVMMTAEHDILRDQGVGFAQLLTDLGVQVKHLRAQGMTHGFARMLGSSKAARRHVELACEQLLAFDNLSS